MESKIEKAYILGNKVTLVIDYDAGECLDTAIYFNVDDDDIELASPFITVVGSTRSDFLADLNDLVNEYYI